MASVSKSLLALRDVVVAALDVGTLEGIVQAVGHDMRIEISTEPAYRERARLLLFGAHNERWLAELLEQLEMHAGARADLVDAIEGVREAIRAKRDGWYSNTENPWDAFFLDEGGIADRATLRRHIEQMAQRVAARRLLLLRGPTMAGKTFSQHLFQWVAEEHGDAMAYVDLSYWDDEDEEHVGGANFFDVATDIARKLEIPIPSKGGHTTVTKQAKHVAIELATAIPPATRAWIFVDHFDTSAADPSVGKLLHALADIALQGKYELRLVVTGQELGRDAAFGKSGPRSLEEEVLGVHDADLERFFVELSAHVLGQPADDAVAERARDLVRQRSGADPYELPAQLWSVAKHLFGGGG